MNKLTEITLLRDGFVLNSSGRLRCLAIDYLVPQKIPTVKDFQTIVQPFPFVLILTEPPWLYELECHLRTL
jgi:hypothetical protein